MNKNDVLDVMCKIDLHMHAMANVPAYSYVEQRNMIKCVFNNPACYDLSTVMLRLTVIDSLYSTNASYAYFSIEELAKAILDLGSEEDPKTYFKKIARGKDDDQNLFGRTYGIRKNTQKGGKLISLVSKYAYYTLLCDESDALGFPIYDSLAIEMLPKLSKVLGVSAEFKNKDCIEEYVACLNALREALFGQDTNQRFERLQQFDILDAYLWRIGKLTHGNYSLLFTKKDYETFFENVFGVPSGSDHINMSLYKKFNENYPNLCKRKKNKSSKSYTYIIDINKLIAEICIKMPTCDILKGVDDRQDAMAALIDSWKKF
jgi:hypothetical protein